MQRPVKVWINRDLYDRAGTCADECGLSVSEWIRRAVLTYDAALSDLADEADRRLAGLMREHLERLADRANRPSARESGTCATVRGTWDHSAGEIRTAVLACVLKCERLRVPLCACVARDETRIRKQRRDLARRLAGAEAFLATEGETL